MNELEQVSTRVLTVPNLISAARLSLVPVFAFLFLKGGHDLASFVVLAVIGSTDWVDGFVARKTGQVSRLGKLLDPVADRVAIIVFLACFAFRGTIALPIAAALLLRDVLVSIAFPILEARGYPRIPVNFVGKAATFIIYTGLGFAGMSLIVPTDLGELISAASRYLLIVGAVLYWVAAALYVRQIVKAARLEVAA